MNSKQRKVIQKYCMRYKQLDDKTVKLLKEIPLGVFTECIPQDNTGTRAQWKSFYTYDSDKSGKCQCFNCWDVYRWIIVDRSVLSVKYVTVDDWVNLRDCLTFMMWKYWIGTPKIWGERPPEVQKQLDEAITRHTDK